MLLTTTRARAVLALEQLVIGLFEALLADDVALRDAVADLRLARLAHVAEQMRRQRVGRILARRHLFDDDVRELEVETTCGNRRHLRERGVLDDDDRPVARLAAMPIDDLLDLFRIEPRHVGQQPHRAIEILGVLADDRNGEGVAVVDEDLAVAIEHHAARRTQRERALMIVLGHLLVLGVLNDLQDPETDPQRGKRDHGAHLQADQPCPDTPSILCYCHNQILAGGSRIGIRSSES